MRKTLCAITMSMFLAGNAMAFNLPEKFKDYENYGRLKIYRLWPVDDVVNIEYDTDGDGVGNVREVYLYTESENYAILKENPIYYQFDLNDDHDWTLDETFYDKAMDGWNGNEIRFMDKFEREFLKKNGAKEI